MYGLLIGFFLVSIVFSFLCSLWEAVLLSITPSFARVKLEEGRRVGKALQSYKHNIDRPLAAILTLNTIAHTVGAIGVGAQATLIWSESNPLITTVLVPVAMTLGILILSEIIPKTIGANQWPRLVTFTVNSLTVVIFVLYPLVWLCQQITRMLKKDKERSVFSHSEFLALAKIGVEEGHVQPTHPLIIGNLLRLDDVQAKDIMTPRSVVLAASENTTIQSFYSENMNLPFSRIPLYEDDNREDISGYILKDTLLESLLHSRGEEPLGSIMHDIIVVPETCPIRELFNEFIERREHIALVVDEYGGMDGIATMEDVIETVLGLEIIDEADREVDMQALARKNWEERAERFGLIRPPEEDDGVDTS